VSPRKRKSVGLRWLQFNLIGVLGFGVQLLLLALIHYGLGWHYLVATAVAVELAVIHNYFWHERWTWSDHVVEPSLRGAVQRLLVFNGSNGAISLLGNVLLTPLFVLLLGLPVLPSNLAAILACSVLNFTVSHRVVFKRGLATLPGHRPTPMQG